MSETVASFLVSKFTVIRIRWADPKPPDQETPLPWQYTALITATLFLNFPLWFEHGLSLWVPGTLLQHAGAVALVGLLIAALFFAAPALISQAARRPLWDLLECSFGSLPAWGVRLAVVSFLVVWMGELISWPASRFVGVIRQRETPLGSASISAALLVFLLITGLQGYRTSAKLALFTNKLGIAILVAALIRVHEGLPTALRGFSPSGDVSAVSEFWYGLSRLALYVGPAVFMAADFGSRLTGRKEVALAAGAGIVLPLCGTLFLVAVIGRATHASGYYQPSLEPTVAMALWSKAAGSAMPSRMMLAAITIFGAVRFGTRALVNSVSLRSFGHRAPRIVLAFLLGIAVWCSVHPFAASLAIAMDLACNCLTVTAAVITGDFVSGRRRFELVRRIDWVGSGALAAGFSTSVLIGVRAGFSFDYLWRQPGLLPAYVVGFATCLLGRTLQRKFGRDPDVRSAS